MFAINAYIALGSNIEPKISFLNDALSLLNDEDTVKVERVSSIYETEPVGYEDQDVFLNQVVKVKTSLTPEQLLTYTQKIESQLGRLRDVRWGPRTIDLDILLYENEVIALDHLTIPHPRMHERAFVLVPLAEIDETVSMSSTGHSVRQLLSLLPAKEIASVVKCVPKL